MTAITTSADPVSANGLIARVDRTRESPLFYRVFGLVAAGMWLDAVDVYMASAVAGSTLKSGWSTIAQNSLFMSAGFLGLFIGSLVAGFIGDMYGRRVAYQLNLILFGGFSFLSAFAPNMAVLTFTRLGAGIGLGAEIVTGYSLVNEFAPVRRRGRWCAIVSVIANCGAPIALLLCTWVIPRFGWRVMFAGIGVFAAVLWYLRRDIPESPRWLAVHGRSAEAERIVTQLETAGHDCPPERASGGVRSHRLALFVAIVAVSATIVCQYTFTSWVPTLLVKRGINLGSSLALSTLMMVGAPVGCVIGALLVDRIGRKATIVPAFLLTSVFGLLYAMQRTETAAMVVGFFLTACFYVLMASVVAVYASELFPTAIRFRGVGIANAVAKLLTVAMPIVVAWVLVHVGVWATFAGISAIAFFAALVVWVWGVETRQRSVG